MNTIVGVIIIVATFLQFASLFVDSFIFLLFYIGRVDSEAERFTGIWLNNCNCVSLFFISDYGDRGLTLIYPVIKLFHCDLWR